MIALLLSLAWSTLGLYTVTAALVAGLVAVRFLGWPKAVSNALALALVAHLVGGTIYRQGVAACEARTARLIAVQKAAIAGLSAEMTARLNAADAERAKAEDDLISLAAKYATNSGRVSCLNTKGDVDAIDGP